MYPSSDEARHAATLVIPGSHLWTPEQRGLASRMKALPSAGRMCSNMCSLYTCAKLAPQGVTARLGYKVR